MKESTRRYAYLGVAVSLIIIGTIATGLLPSAAPYQAVAGGIIVAGFAMGYWCLGATDFFD